MTRERYIWHVALGAGRGTREPRDVVSYEILREGWAHIQRALAAPGGDPIPGQAGYVMAAQTQAGALLCFVGRAQGNLALATFGVATKSLHGAKLWKVLHQGRPEYDASAGDVPRTPYCAVRAEMGLRVDQAAAAWLDGYQLAVAWAWLDGPLG